MKIRNAKKTDYRLFAISDYELATIVDTGIQMKAFEEAVKKEVNTLACKL